MVSSLPDLKVCILTETYHPEVGGGETQARALADGLASKGYRVIVITRRSQSASQKVEAKGSVAIYRLWPAGYGHLKKWGMLFSSISALLRLRSQYQVVLVCGFRVLGPAAVIAAKLLDKQCILKADSLGEMSGEFFSAGLARFGIKPSSWLVRLFLGGRDRIIRKADGFVAISAAVQAELEAAGLHRASVYRIPNGVDTDRFCPVGSRRKQSLREQLRLPTKQKIVTFTGRLVSYKGLPLLLRVWQQIRSKRSDATLLLVGSGSLDIHNCEAVLRQFVSDHAMEQSVCFAGSVHNVHEYLQASDLFVFPTEREAFGISLIEAMACGLPVISTSVGGIQDILYEGYNGLVVRPKEFEDLYRALETLLSDQHLGRRLGQEARRTAENRYSETAVTSRYIELFNVVRTQNPQIGRCVKSEGV
jgi:glycosyltransferase involved in cell wall biosynthesis